MKSSELMKKKVVIAPFNTEAIFLYHQLSKEGIEVIAFMDSDCSLHNSNYIGTMIIPYFHFEGIEIVVICAKAGYTAKENIYSELISVNYDQGKIVRQENIEFAYACEEVVKDIDLQGLYKIRNSYWMRLLKEKIFKYGVKDGFSIQSLSLYITTRCTLKCKGCCVLMDYFYPKDQKDMSIEDTIHSFDLVMKHLDFVNQLVPIGGEPFLYKDIDKLLLYIISSDYVNKIGTITLVTNGTVLPSISTLNIIGKNRHIIQVWISDYGNLSRKKLELISLLNQYGCFYMNHSHTIWNLTNQPVIPSSDLSDDALYEKCANCVCRDGGTIKIVGNKVYSCHFIAFATECHAIPHNKYNYLDINHDDITKEKLRTFINGIQPGMMYCDSAHYIGKESHRLIPVAEQATSVHECIRYD